MKSIIKAILAIYTIVLLSSCSESRITIQISNHIEEAKVVLITDNSGDQEIHIDIDGAGILPIPNQKPGYAVLNYGSQPRLLWLDPSDDIAIKFNGISFSNEVTFEGSTTPINDYLNKSDLQEIMINDCGLEETVFMAKADSLLAENLRKLTEAQLPEQFMEIEKERLTYFTYSAFTFYPEFYPRLSNDTTYSPSEVYLDKVKELFVLEESYLEIKEYKDFIKSAVSLLAREEFPEVSPAIDRNIAYIEKNIDNESIAAYFINSYVYSYVERNGTEGSEKYMETFNRFVKKPEMVQAMDELADKWDTLRAGKPSPDFMATDKDGKEYGLADFKGKYIYIDIWATWCAPCRKEAPFLKELEEIYKVEDIYIISLSCDTDRAAWEKSLIQDNKEGIQIILDPSSAFLNDYMVKGIPHFILLDKEGKIMDSQMTRPSNPATKEYLDSLLNGAILHTNTTQSTSII